MYATLLIIHSWLRWIFLLAALYCIIRSASRSMNNRSFSKDDNTAATILLACTHTMLLLGLILLFISPSVQATLQQGMGSIMKDSVMRQRVVEHPVAMILAVVLIQIGRIKSKKAYEDRLKYRRSIIYYSLALIFVLMSIPWKTAPLFQGLSLLGFNF